jgi:hypothetical protein
MPSDSTKPDTDVSPDEIRALPPDRVCPYCSAGRLVATRCSLAKVLGPFHGTVFRRCDNPECLQGGKYREAYVGIPAKRKKKPSDQPPLFE